VAAVPAAPHVTAQTALPVQVVLQSPSHLTLQLDESEHAAVLAFPSCSLHVALVLQATAAAAPSLKSQLELAVQVRSLASPPTPLQSDESLQVRVKAPLVWPWHFVESLQLSEQSPVPQSVLQSAPTVHVHAESTHAQPVPEQVGAGASLPPQAAAHANVKESKAMDPSFISLASPAITPVR